MYFSIKNRKNRPPGFYIQILVYTPYPTQYYFLSIIYVYIKSDSLILRSNNAPKHYVFPRITFPLTATENLIPDADF